MRLSTICFINVFENVPYTGTFVRFVRPLGR